MIIIVSTTSSMLLPARKCTHSETASVSTGHDCEANDYYAYLNLDVRANDAEAQSRTRGKTLLSSAIKSLPLSELYQEIIIRNP